MFDPILNNQALSQKIVIQITKKVTSGVLKPGDRLPTERAMAEEFQVSRTAIRDAIKILSGRGLLEVRHGVGIFVASQHNSSEVIWHFTQANLRDVFEIRKAMETQAVYLAAERRDAAHIDRLKNILEEARAHSDNPDILNDADAQFHVTLAEASQNQLIVEVMWTILDAVAETRQASLSIPSRPQVSLDEHLLILEAVIDQDAERARALMFRHLESVESSIASSIDLKTLVK